MIDHRGIRLLVAITVLGLAGCSALRGKNAQKNKGAQSYAGQIAGVKPGSPLAVNEHLWHATLETLAFMPLAQTDSYGGLILTDWYTNPQFPQERFKVTVYILDKRLRADALKVNVSRQEQGKDSQWRDVKAHPGTAVKIENAILTRARELRIASFGR